MISPSSILYAIDDNNDNDNNNDDIKQSSGLYTASEQRKAKTKTTLIKFLLSRSIRSSRNISPSTQGQNILIHSVTTVSKKQKFWHG